MNEGSWPTVQKNLTIEFWTLFLFSFSFTLNSVFKIRSILPKEMCWGRQNRKSCRVHFLSFCWIRYFNLIYVYCLFCFWLLLLLLFLFVLSNGWPSVRFFGTFLFWFFRCSLLKLSLKLKLKSRKGEGNCLFASVARLPNAGIFNIKKEKNSSWNLVTQWDKQFEIVGGRRIFFIKFCWLVLVLFLGAVKFEI